MSSHHPLAVIFGAGKTGRGFAAHLAYLSGYRIILIDSNIKLVRQMQGDEVYTVRIIGDVSKDCTIHPFGVFHTGNDSWMKYLVDADIAFTAVFGNNLPDLAETLLPALRQRFQQNPGKPLNFVMCENFSNASTTIRNKISSLSGDMAFIEWLTEKAGFSDAMILRTCLHTSKGCALDILAQDYFDLPCDGDAFKGNVPKIIGLKPLPDFKNQVRRKIYTYNCINAVITFLGYKKGYTQLYEAAVDPEILKTARLAAAETSQAQVAEFNFDPDEQAEWVESAFKKFSDKGLPDPISRNGADPARKLGRDDRLIGPALLAIKHGIHPEGLIEGILAGFFFQDKDTGFSLQNEIQKRGIDDILTGVCSLQPEETLFHLIKKKYKENEY